MNRRLVFVLLLVLGVAAAVLFVGVEPQTNRASAQVLRSRGLLAAARYLEVTGVEVQLWERPLDELSVAPGASLVIALPMMVGLTGAELTALDRWRLGGGRVVVLTTGEEPKASDRELLNALDLYTAERGEGPPMWWFDWKDWATRQEPITSEAGWPSPVSIQPGRFATLPVGEAEVIYRGVENDPAVYRLAPPGWGEVVVVDNATALGNRWLGEAENLALLERLFPAGSPVFIDEWRQGYSAIEVVDADVLTPSQLLLTHLALLYLAAIWTLSRPFGPPLRAAGVRRGSVSRDLLALASLHRYSKHAEAAGQRLLDLVRTRAGRRSQELGLPERFEGGEDELVELAQRIGRLQAEHKLS